MRSQAKRALSMFLVLVLVLGMLPAYAASDSQQAFADIEGHWARQAIETWSGYDVIKGYNGSFRPDASITRAEMAQVITNLLKLTKTKENIFFDVEADSWYAEAVQKCAAAGIMVGDSGRFRPGDLISRQEAMVVVARTLGIKPVENPDLVVFEDGETADPWARGLLAALVAAKIVQGTTGDLLAPLVDISRAEIVAILNKAVSAYIAQPGTYTLDAQHSGGTVLVVSQGVTLDGTAAGTLVIGAGAESGAVVLRDFTADAVIVAARAIRLDIAGKSRLQSLELFEQAEQVVLEIGRNAVVSDITPLEDTQIVREKIPSGDSGSSGNQSAVSLQGGENVSGLSEGEHVEVAFTVTPAEAILTAVSSNDQVAGVSVENHTVRVTGISKGTATVTVTASASGYQSTSAQFTVSVTEEIAADADFVLFDGSKVPTIYVSADDHRQVTRAVTDLQKDVERVTDKKPMIQNTAEGLEGLAIIVGSIDQSPIIKGLMAAGKLNEAVDLEGKWESYLLKIVENPMDGVTKALVIAGSDERGTAYGIYDLSEQIGVSPWYYWGDILPQVKSRIVIDQPLKIQGEPSVKYRGIFINDEQALTQWAAANDPVGETGGNLGPDTYEKVFELLLRLKANYLWPAMHSEPRLGPSDHFSKYPETRQLADDYGIIVGSSHCEPMMRNGTVEWGEFLQANGYLTGVDFAKAIGTGNSNKVDGWMYNYNSNNPGATPIPRYDYSENTMYKLAGQDVTQKAFIDAYWNSAVEMYKDYAVSYTLGMRGLHDDGFNTANASSTAGKLNVLQAVVDSQVKMLEDNDVNKDSISIFVPYKEVLPLYDAGLGLPDDTIIVWAEDNHGYIRRFPTEEENARSGGNGVYYHVNYVGRQTYTWMNSTPPALMLSELGNAYDSGIKSLWVLNVGDIKPSEIGTEFFLQMAWDINKWTPEKLNGTETSSSFFAELSEKWFPSADAEEVSEILREYYHLNLSRKPEHTTLSESRGAVFDPVNYGDESMQRLADYQDLMERCAAIMEQLEVLGDYQADAFYQHVAYSVIASYYNNLKYYHAQKNLLYNQQGRYSSANLHAALVDWAEEQEVAATAMYNTGISNGKWNLIMQPDNWLRKRTSVKPTGMVTNNSIAYASIMGVVAEGELTVSENSKLNLSSYTQDTRFIDVFNMGELSFQYTISSDRDWVVISEPSGTIYDDQRVFLTIDWANLPAGDQTATVTVSGAGTSKAITVTVENPSKPRSEISGYAEANGYVAIETEHFTDTHFDREIGFTVFDGLGRSGGSVSAGPKGVPNYMGKLDQAPYLTYEVYFQSAGTFPTTVYRVPSLDGVGQRLALGVDNATPTVVHGQYIAESGPWENNITNGIEKISTSLTIPAPGYHTIKLYMIDSGVSVDRIVINTGGEVKSNQGPAESYHSVYNTNPAVTPKLLSMELSYLDAYMEQVEQELVNLSGAGQSIVSAELAAVKESLSKVEDDTVRRSYARLKAALANAHVIDNVDTLMVAALLKAQAIQTENTTGIAIYAPAAVAELQTAYHLIAAEWNAGGLTAAKKLELYSALMTAINKVNAQRILKVAASNTQSPNLPENVIDSDSTTRWASSATTYPQWIEVDLGTVYELEDISIVWYNNAPDGTGNRYYQYNVQVSTDGTIYTTAVDRSSNTAKNTVTDSMGSKLARYVKINVTGSNGGNASLYEIVLTGAQLPNATSEQLYVLQTALNAAKAKLADANTYTIDSYTPMKAVIAEAETLVSGGIADLVVQTTQSLQTATQALKTRTVITSDTFDNITSVSDLTHNGWKFYTTGGTVTLETETDGNKYLKIAQDKQGAMGGDQLAGASLQQGTSTLSVEAQKSFAETSGKVYVQFRARSDAPKSFFGTPYLYKNDTSTTILGAVAMRDNGEIRATYQYNSSSLQKLTTFTGETWYDITLIVDSRTQKMQVYVDGVLAGKDLALRNTLTTLGMLRFYSDEKNAGYPMAVGCIDDLYVYQEAEPADLIKVATVGDSLTAGSGVSNAGEKYPAQLQTLLGTDYLVGNFGVSGATMINAGTDKNGAAKGYIYETQYVPSHSFAPDVVVIMLGTNDSKTCNWDTMSGDYVKDALALIESYRALGSHPTVYIASSATVVPGTNTYDIQSEVVHNQIVPLQRQIAQIADCGFIDVHEATKNATLAEFPDHVHGNATGYAIIAQAIYNGITASYIPKASAIVSSQGVTCTTPIGQTPMLPVFAPVTYADGTTGIAEIVWDLTDLSFDAVGEVIVPGKVKGLEAQSSAQVTVEDTNSVEEELRQAISDAELVLAVDYTPDSYYALKTAVAAGEATLSSGGVSELSAALAAIETARENLVERDYIINDSFDSFEDLDVVKAAGWALVETGGTVTLVSEGDNRYLKFEQTTKDAGTTVEARRSFEPVTGKFYVEVKIRADVHQTGFGAPYVLKDSTSTGNDNVLGLVSMRNAGGDITVGNQKGGGGVKTVGKYALEAWNTVCLIFDTSKGTIEAYVNGEHVASNLPMRNELETASLLRFYCDDNNASRPLLRAYIDDVRVYQELK